MTHPEAGLAQVNGTRLYYELAGHGQPLVLIHGFGLDRRLWDEQFHNFARRFRVLRYDLRGFGRSALPGAEPYRHHDDLRAVLDHFGMEQSHLVGLSLGGLIGLNFALAYPARVARLVLVDSALGAPSSRAWEAEVAPIWREARARGVAATKQRWQNIAMFAPTRAHAQAAAKLAQMTADWSGWQFVNRDPESTGGGAAERLEDIQAPTLVLVGEHDIPDFQANADRLLAIPLARKAVIPGAGHLPPLEAPALFEALVLGFLEAGEALRGAV